MKKPNLLVFFLAAIMQTASAQNVGIGTNTPHASAQLDVSSDTRGMLVPRVSLTNVLQAAPVTAPLEGLLVYNTNDAIAGAGSGGKGFYYWTGERWIKLTGSLEGWSLTGNGVTDTATNFIGTTDNRSLMFRVNNQPAGRIEVESENLFLGTESGNANVSGNVNTYVGALSGKHNNGRGNTMVGARAGQNNYFGHSNTNLGFRAGGRLGEGSQNTALGYDAGSFMGTGVGSLGNVSVGYESGFNLRNGAGNVTIGRNAGNGGFGQTGIGSYNIYIGDSSAPVSNNAQRNIAIGRRSGRNISSAANNVLIGDSAGHNLTTGSGNVFVGDGARGSTNNIQNATALGPRAFASANNVLVLGAVAGQNGATNGVNVGIGTTNPQAKLDVVGTALISGEINRPSTGAANLVPIAYGNISANGNIESGTGNFTVTLDAANVYIIQITGENYNTTGYITQITPRGTSAHFAVANANANRLTVRVFNITGTVVANAFHFVVYKP